MKRRDFLKIGGMGLAGAMVGRNPAFAGYEPRFADRQLRVGLIGTGWFGKVDLLRLTQVAPVNVVSLCDVQTDMLDEAAQIVASRQVSGKEPRKYTDYRKMLAEKDLDAVLIDTPDHWHALQMIEAVNSGVDVYVQKPIGVDVVECQAMYAAARRNNSVVQVGMQRRSTPHLVEAKRDIIDSGMLGKVAQVDIFTYYGGKGDFYQEPSPVPATIDYDMWTGPAPMLPYRDMIRQRNWRAFMEYGNGYLGDMGVHMLDMTRWLLGLRWPKRISSSGGIFVKKNSVSNTPDTQTAVFEYDDLNVVWNHRNWSGFSEDKYPWGGFFYGENGLFKASVYGYDFKEMHSNKTKSADVVYETEEFPEDKTEPGVELMAAGALRRHMMNWLDCIADRSRPVADIEEGMISSVCCILGNIALQLGRTLEWDAEAGIVKGDDEANALLARAYRAPWIHPQL